MNGRTIEVYIKMPLDVPPPKSGKYILIKEKKDDYAGGSAYSVEWDGKQWDGLAKFYTHWLRKEII